MAMGLCGCGDRPAALCEQAAGFCPEINREECRQRLDHTNNRSLLSALEACLSQSRNCPDALNCLSLAGGIIPPVGQL